MADENKKEDTRQSGDSTKVITNTDISTIEGGGEGTVWVRQNNSVVVEDCQQNTQNCLYDLGKWFKDKTGHMLVCTAGTNGSHASGEHSHAAGWKLDLNDWYGPENLQGDIFGYPLDTNGTDTLKAFCDYGHSLGCGMSIEGDHVDVQTDGYEWTTGANYGGYRNPNGTVAHMNGSGKGSSLINSALSKFHNIKDLGGTVELMPSKKTYCEPVYPDYIYVIGNIPNTAVESTLVNSNHAGQQVGDYNIMTGSDMQDLTGISMNAFTTTQAQDLAQRPYNPDDAELEVKVPNAGKPLNNMDPYPVDLKIEELELHSPRVKQYKLPYDKKVACTKTLAAAILTLSDFSEKRIVKLENTLATVMRYLFAIGSRMHVNCQYYGGQDHRSYKKLSRCAYIFG